MRTLSNKFYSEKREKVSEEHNGQQITGTGIVISFEVAKLIPGNQVSWNSVRVRLKRLLYRDISF